MMPVLEKYEIQQNRIWYRVEITEEQKEEYLKWQAEKKGDYVVPEVEEPEWMDDLDWDHHYDKPGNDEVISIELVNEEKK
tara:strand:- start:58 stop:297 length:240 start_codon:yes stop_codon:yes gene_type:complete